jgi:chromosome segregation ATPase
VQVRHDAGQAAEKATQELLKVKERLQASEQAVADAHEERKLSLQQLTARHETESKQAAQTARDEMKRIAAEKSELQRLHNEATTEAACLRVRNEHLQGKIQDETNRGELQQAKKDFERAAMLNDKLRTENDQLLAQQRAHQHELQERERRIEQVQKKMQEQEREFSAERLRLRLRIEEENAKQAYRKVAGGQTTSVGNSSATTTKDKV